MSDNRSGSGGELGSDNGAEPSIEPRFPRFPEGNPEGQGDSDVREKPTAGLGTILVVEDNPTTQKMIRVTLESHGYTVLEAVDGATAVEWARKRTPDLVLQDLILPDTDGLELVARLREALGLAVPILCLTGFLSRVEQLQAVQGGFSTVLLKPVNPLHLIDVVQTHLVRWSGDPPAIANGLRVIVVDDDPLQLRLTRTALARAGFDVEATAKGAEALEQARVLRADALVSDVLMPGMDGFQLCLMVRQDPELGPRLPVILVSSHYIEDADRTLATRVGASALLARSSDAREVVQAIVTALGSEARTPPVASTETVVAREHEQRILWQLERQVSQNAGLAQRCTVQAAQLAVLAGTAESLARDKALNGVLGEVLSTCLDVLGISKGVLYIASQSGHFELREKIGFSDAGDRDRLARCFGQEDLLREIVDGGRVATVPSGSVDSDSAQKLLLELGVTSALVVPVVWSNQVRGALLLGARREDVSADQSIAFARVLGMQMAQAIGLAQTFTRLTLAEERYRTLMESAHDPVSVLTPDGIILEVNRRWEDLLQLPKERIVGRSISDFVAPGPANHEALVALAPAAGAPGQAPAAWTQSLSVRRADGSEALLEVSNVALQIAGEQVVLAISRDMTEQIRAQEQLMVSDRMASVGLLAAGLAHEINNPLAVAVANLDLAAAEVARLTREGIDVKTLEEELQDAREASDRVRQITLDLRLFSRTEQAVSDPVDIREVLSSAIRMASNEIRHRARLVTHFAEVPPVRGNASRFGQVFLNLLVNAAQAIEEGHPDDNEVRVDVSVAADDPGRVVIEVSDTGPGIAPDILKHLFTPFFTTKPPGIGTGLGLSICERIVAAAGGEITVESRVGHGTWFRVRLPVFGPDGPVESPGTAGLPRAPSEMAAKATAHAAAPGGEAPARGPGAGAGAGARAHLAREPTASASSGSTM